MKEKKLLVLSFGANIGERQKNIELAYTMIEQEIGEMQKKSSFFETKPWGFESDNLFINSVACFFTSLTCYEVLQKIHQIENSLGRQRTNWAGYQSRTIDIDILFYDNLIIESKDLIIPHPLLHKRDFVLMPLKEILHDFIHPILKQKISEIKLN